MPAAKKPKSSSAPRASASGAEVKAVRSGAKATATSARKAAERTATQAKAGAKRTTTTARAAATKTRRAAGGPDGLANLAEQLAKGEIKPSDLVITTRDRIRATLEEAAERGRVTRKDANELIAELVRRGQHQSEDLVADIEQLMDRGREKLESAGKHARKAEPVDRLVRGADRARRTVGVGPTFPILGYDDLNARRVQERLKDLSRPELRKVRDYERKHANRKSVLGPIEKTLG
jgi:polyhydroxyalkanoate synthesis regulator phasin